MHACAIHRAAAGLAWPAGGRGAYAAVDPVSGPLSAAVLAAVRPGGTHILYGRLDPVPIPVREGGRERGERQRLCGTRAGHAARLAFLCPALLCPAFPLDPHPTPNATSLPSPPL